MTIVHRPVDPRPDRAAPPPAASTSALGTSVWYREDVRLADGASRVVPAVFVAYRPRRGSAGSFAGVTDDGRTRPTWVRARRRLRRHWADDATDPAPRLAWAPPVVEAPDFGPTPALVAISVIGIVGFFALVLWGLQ